LNFCFLSSPSPLTINNNYIKLKTIITTIYNHLIHFAWSEVLTQQQKLKDCPGLLLFQSMCILRTYFQQNDEHLLFSENNIINKHKIKNRKKKRKKERKTTISPPTLKKYTNPFSLTVART
jgi:hypothetical protein